MGPTIHVNEDIQDRLMLLARANEAEIMVLHRLIRCVEEDLEEIIDARWVRLQKEKAQYIPQEEV